MGKRRCKKILSVIVAFALVLVSLSSVTIQTEAKAKSVWLSAKKKTLTKGKKYQITVKKKKGIKIKKKTFTKKGAAIKVSKKGKVTAVKKGKATVTCKIKYTKKGKKKVYSRKCTCTIYVQNKKTSAKSTKKPNTSTSLQASDKPGASDVPATVETPQAGKDPAATDSTLPSESAKPGVTDSTVPGESANPTATNSAAPGESVNPTATDSAAPSESANPTATNSAAPGISANPGATNSAAPGISANPVATSSAAPTESVNPGATSSAAPTESANPGATNSAAPTESVNPGATNSAAPTESANPEATSTAPAEPTQPTAAPTTAPSGGETETTQTAFELVHKMGLGINLGNTMEAYCKNAYSTTQLETNWGQPVTTQEMITGMKNAGFRSLRIPVSWSSMMSDDGKYTIKEELLARVETIMNYALKEDMYVIINIHWDGQWWGQFGDADSSVRKKAWIRYEAFWTQIATYYKDYSDHLIFESANEELGDRLNDDWTMSGNEKTGTLSTSECYQTLNAINQKFVDIVRNSGGNNATRFLLIAGYDTDIDKTCNDQFQMPTDTIKDHLMVSVHYYSPGTYCIASDPSCVWGYSDTWGTESDIASMKEQLNKMKIKFTNQGIPVVIGEYGVTDSYINGSNVRKEGRDLFFKNLCTYAISNGMCPMLWNTDNVYNKSTCAIINSTEAADFLALANTAETTDIYAPSESNGEYIWKGTLQNKSYNQYVTSTNEDSNIIVTGNGGCFTLSGVDWNKFTNPVIELSSEGLTGSRYCKFATSNCDDNPNWPYVSDEEAFYKDNWTLKNTITIDTSVANLSGTQSLYFSINGDDFEGSITIKIKEKVS